MAWNGSTAGSGALSGAGTGASAGMMIGGPVGAAIGAGAGAVLGGVIGGLFGSDDAKKAREAMEAAMAEIQAVGAPPALAEKIIYDKMVSVGNFTPEIAQFIQSQAVPIAKDALKDNPEYVQKMEAQSSALAQLARTGIGVEDIAAFQKAQNQAATNLNAAQQDVIRKAQETGRSRDGATLLAQMLNAQNASQQEAQNNLDVAARASAARREAINQAFNAADSLRQRDMSTKQYNRNMLLDTLKNEDTYSRRLNELNTRTRNDAGLRNIENSQNISNRNVEISNQQMQDRIRQQQWEYQQRLVKAEAMARARQGQQQYYENAANRNAQQINDMIGGIGQMAGAYGQYQNNQLQRDYLKARTDAMKNTNNPSRVPTNNGMATMRVGSYSGFTPINDDKIYNLPQIDEDNVYNPEFLDSRMVWGRRS